LNVAQEPTLNLLILTPHIAAARGDAADSGRSQDYDNILALLGGRCNIGSSERGALGIPDECVTVICTNPPHLHHG
jgi:hypothetical protein